jgi:tRNA pseudouridine55 synthase
VQVFGSDPHAFLGTAHVAANELIPERLLSPIEVQDMLQAAASAGPALHSDEPPALA